MLELTAADREMLSGDRGTGVQLAMRMIVHVAREFAAEKLIDVSWAHVASAYAQGRGNLDFAERLAAAHTRVAVPTTLTACSLNLRDERQDAEAVRLIDLYERMGCEPVMTCSPYDALPKPGFGDHLAWCESSAVAYANSVLGARSNRYVEFVDMCAAITGRVPYFGLHTDEGRRATVLCQVDDMPNGWLDDDWFYHLLGIAVGRDSGAGLPALDGLGAGCTQARLRSLGAAAATSGSLSMFHVIGVTPEAASRDTAFRGEKPDRVIRIDAARIRETALGLGRSDDAELAAICVGAPHFSFREFEALVGKLAGRRVAPALSFYASTSAAVVGELEEAGLLEGLMSAGIEFVVGRCTYYRPALPGTEAHVMTNSAKWAYYAPSALGSCVTFASLAECVESACAGHVVLSESIGV